MKLMHIITGGMLAAMLAANAGAANRPSGYTTICTENQTCSVATSTNVAFGRADQFFYKTLTGSFLCAESTFGGRVAGGVNECSVPSTSSSSSAASSVSSSRSSSSSVASSSSSRSSSSSSSSVASSVSSSSSSTSSSTSSTASGTTNSVDGFAATAGLGLNTTTGGAGGTAVKVSTFAELNLYADSNDAYIIMVSGTIQLSGMTPLRGNKSVIGLPGAKITGGGFEIYKRSNIIIRNIAFENAQDDAIKINQNTHHVWVDHCSFTDGAAPDPDGATHDGLLDITRQSSFVTVSYNHFMNHNKSILIGHSDSASNDVGFLKTTLHHNWFDGTRSRHPRLRFGEAHVYNNYFLNNDTYGSTSTMNGKMVVEGNYYRNVPFPTLVGYAESGPGDLVQRNNVLDASGAFQTQGSAFDPTSYYSYTVENPAGIPASLPSKAGPGVIDPWKAAGVAPF